MAKVTALKKAKKVSFNDVLEGTKKDKTKEKSKIPVLHNTPLNIRQKVDQVVELKAEQKEIKAALEEAGDHVVEYVIPIQDDDGFKGKFRHSYTIPGTNNRSVKFVSANRFSISPNDEQEIRKILGSHFHSLIDVLYEVKLKPEVFEEKEKQERLMELLGDSFVEFFETTKSLTVKEDFDKDVYKAINKKKLNNLRVFCKQSRPSLR